MTTELFFASKNAEVMQQSKPEGGAFGIWNAWSNSIKEHGWKTLHSHFILWVHEWSALLLALRSDERSIIPK
jgi:hypothetical protein